jgi:hypothetical protein
VYSSSVPRSPRHRSRALQRHLYLADDARPPGVLVQHAHRQVPVAAHLQHMIRVCDAASSISKAYLVQFTHSTHILSSLRPSALHRSLVRIPGLSCTVRTFSLDRQVPVAHNLQHAVRVTAGLVPGDRERGWGGGGGERGRGKEGGERTWGGGWVGEKERDPWTPPAASGLSCARHAISVPYHVSVPYLSHYTCLCGTCSPSRAVPALHMMLMRAVGHVHGRGI